MANDFLESCIAVRWGGLLSRPVLYTNSAFFWWVELSHCRGDGLLIYKVNTSA